MGMNEWLTIGATLLSPLIAVQVTRWADRRRDQRDRRFRIFRTLMATRAQLVSAAHVEALNLIDVEFHGPGRTLKEKAITEAWKIYLDHLNTPSSSSQEWLTKRQELFITMLQKMAFYFGYDLDQVHLKNQTYYPNAHNDLENDEYAIRKAWISILKGERSLPVSRAPAPNVAPANLPNAMAGTNDQSSP